mmetsp:Transcript_35418/g.69467  ORF Transcript_35418/g.69467 Transcript_35418/m.69467 type:complete len:1148 (+) Transcript_35418:13-3456(+)
MFTKCSSASVAAIFLFSVLVLLDSVDGHSWFQVPIRKRKPEIDLGEVAGAATTRKERKETNKLLKKVGKELNQYRYVPIDVCIICRDNTSQECLDLLKKQCIKGDEGAYCPVCKYNNTSPMCTILSKDYYNRFCTERKFQVCHQCGDFKSITSTSPECWTYINEICSRLPGKDSFCDPSKQCRYHDLREYAQDRAKGKPGTSKVFRDPICVQQFDENFRKMFAGSTVCPQRANTMQLTEKCKNENTRECKDTARDVCDTLYNEMPWCAPCTKDENSTACKTGFNAWKRPIANARFQPVSNPASEWTPILQFGGDSYTPTSGAVGSLSGVNSLQKVAGSVGVALNVAFQNLEKDIGYRLQLAGQQGDSCASNGLYELEEEECMHAWSTLFSNTNTSSWQGRTALAYMPNGCVANSGGRNRDTEGSVFFNRGSELDFFPAGKYLICKTQKSSQPQFAQSLDKDSTGYFTQPGLCGGELFGNDNYALCASTYDLGDPLRGQLEPTNSQTCKDFDPKTGLANLPGGVNEAKSLCDRENNCAGFVHWTDSGLFRLVSHVERVFTVGAESTFCYSRASKSSNTPTKTLFAEIVMPTKGCMTVDIGNSMYPTKTVFSNTSGLVCPRLLTGANMLGFSSRTPATYSVETVGPRSFQVTRLDRRRGWEEELEMRCCTPQASTFAKLSDSDINQLSSGDAMSVYKFTTAGSEVNNPMFVRTKDKFDDTKPKFGFQKYDTCTLDSKESCDKVRPISKTEKRDSWYPGTDSAFSNMLDPRGGDTCLLWQTDVGGSISCNRNGTTINGVRCFKSGLQCIPNVNQTRTNIIVFKYTKKANAPNAPSPTPIPSNPMPVMKETPACNLGSRISCQVEANKCNAMAEPNLSKLCQCALELNICLRKANCDEVKSTGCPNAVGRSPQDTWPPTPAPAPEIPLSTSFMFKPGYKQTTMANICTDCGPGNEVSPRCVKTAWDICLDYDFEFCSIVSKSPRWTTVVRNTHALECSGSLLKERFTFLAGALEDPAPMLRCAGQNRFECASDDGETCALGRSSMNAFDPVACWDKRHKFSAFKSCTSDATSKDFCEQMSCTPVDLEDEEDAEDEGFFDGTEFKILVGCVSALLLVIACVCTVLRRQAQFKAPNNLETPILRQTPYYSSPV